MRSIPFKKSVLAGVAGLALIGASIGAVAAQQPPASPVPTRPAPKPSGGQMPADKQAKHDQYINALAAKLNVTPEQLKQAMQEVHAARPEGAQRGQAPADRQAARQQHLNALAQKLNVTPERLQQAMEQTRQELGVQNGPRGGMRGGGFHGGFEAAAKAMNISVEQLRQELPGKSLADVARAHNVDPTTVANALKADANARIDQAAAAGRIPADQVAQAKQRMSERIDQMMTRQMPTGGQRPGGPNR